MSVIRRPPARLSSFTPRPPSYKVLHHVLCAFVTLALLSTALSTMMAKRIPSLLILLIVYLVSLAGTTGIKNENNSPAIETQTVDDELDDVAQIENVPAISKSNTTDILQRALQKAIGGGVPGAVAGVIQVLGLMWLVRYFFLQSKKITTYVY